MKQEYTLELPLFADDISMYNSADERLLQRFRDKFKVEDCGYETPCWTWTACSVPGRYGQFEFEDKLIRAYRYSYTVLKCSVFPEMGINPLCENWACVNPEHLEAVSCISHKEDGSIHNPNDSRLPERFRSKFEVVDMPKPEGVTGPCWMWKAYCVKDGYGQVSIKGRATKCHRYTYQVFIGPIPKWLEIDHKCRNRPCCNPDHLRAVTHEVNVQCGVSPSAKDRLKTHCKYGHPFSGHNLIKRSDGGRGCRECDRLRSVIKNVAKRMAKQSDKITA